MKLTLTIATDNEAMTTPDAVADALRKVADKIDTGGTIGPIIDYNGNSVGSFTYDPEAAL